MSSNFVLPIRYLGGQRGAGGAGGEPSRFSLLGEPLPATHESCPPLGITVAAVMASATVRANENAIIHSAEGAAAAAAPQTMASKRPFQLPIRKVVDRSDKTDLTAEWDSTL